WYFTAETLYWASPLIACCCLGVVTVMTLKPDWGSKNSFLDEASSASLVATVWQAAISNNAAIAVATFVSAATLNSCFTFSCITPYQSPRASVPIGPNPPNCWTSMLLGPAVSNVG